MTREELADKMRDEAKSQGDFDVYMVMVVQASGSVFVKDLDFFKSQGGMTQSWGAHWIPIIASGIEDARKRGCELPGARPYERQAK